MSHRYLLLAAASPLCFLAGLAHAETDITTAVTTPIATATAKSGGPDDISVTATGSVKLTSGTAVTLNSSNTVNIDGTVAVTDANNAVGLAVVGGNTGQVTGAGAIQVSETYTATDTNSDGIVDGPFAKGSGRFGIRVTGALPFHGSIATTSGVIQVQGNDSAAISVETAMDGQLKSGSTVTVAGDRSFGIHTTGTVGGSVIVNGAVTATGAGTIGVAVDNNVGGGLVINQSVLTSGYRTTTRPTAAVIAKMTADELQQGGPAIRIQGDVAQGVVIAAPPASLDASAPDANHDGVTDASEITATVQSFGAAPAMLVGASGRAVHLGMVSSGLPYGLTILGNAEGQGVYDGVAATGVQVGGLGGPVTIDGGIYVGGQILSDAVKADSTALHLGAGATVHAITNVGVIKATSTSGAAVNVRAIEIDAGATSKVLFNSGSIVAALAGSAGQVTAVQDTAGLLHGISNTGVISAIIATTDGSTPTGSRIALDLRANTIGVNVLQALSGVAGSTPSINGDVLFGTGSANLNLQAGSLTGAVAFGGGTNTLVLNGGATMVGALTKTGGTLSLDVTNGSLTVTNAGATSLASLNVGATSTLVMTIDPTSGGSTRFDVAGAANIATGAKVGLRFGSKLTSPATYTLIKATTLTAGAIDQVLLGTTPYLYQASLRVDATQNAVLADVRQRTTTELGLTAPEAAAFQAVYGNFDRDPALRDALLGKTTQAGFIGLYDQLLPDHSGGLFQTMSAANAATGRALDQGAGRLPADGYRAWTQEIGLFVNRDADASSKYDASAFGMAGGVETPETRLGILGLQTSFISVDVDEKVRTSASNLNGSVFAAGFYWRANGDGIVANVSATGGYAWMGELRAVTDSASSLTRTSKSSWSGLTGAIHGDVSYRFDMGPYYARPQLSADYFVLQEDSRTEHGGGVGVDLSLAKRNSQELDGFAGVTVGARFGEAFSWSPELTAGYKAVGGNGAGDTKGQFLAGGPSFDIATPKLSGGGAVVRAALRGQGEYFDVVIEGGGEFHDNYQAYDARVTARWVF